MLTHNHGRPLPHMREVVEVMMALGVHVRERVLGDGGLGSSGESRASVQVRSLPRGLALRGGGPWHQ